MKAKDVIKYMNEYDSEDELLVMWWDSDALLKDIVSDKEWNQVVNKTDGYGFDGVNQDVYEILQETLSEIRNTVSRKQST